MRRKEDYKLSSPRRRATVQSDFVESAASQAPAAWRDQNLTAGTLVGPGRVWCLLSAGQRRRQKLRADIPRRLRPLQPPGHRPRRLPRHPAGRRAGAMLLRGLPHHVGMTAKLEVNYKAPAMANQYLVLKGRTASSRRAARLGLRGRSRPSPPRKAKAGRHRNGLRSLPSISPRRGVGACSAARLSSSRVARTTSLMRVVLLISFEAARHDG